MPPGSRSFVATEAAVQTACKPTLTPGPTSVSAFTGPLSTVSTCWWENHANTPSAISTKLKATAGLRNRRRTLCNYAEVNSTTVTGRLGVGHLNKKGNLNFWQRTASASEANNPINKPEMTYGAGSRTPHRLNNVREAVPNNACPR